jgi:hypothetical protein
MSGHFRSDLWAIGNRLWTHTCCCPLCGGPGGDIILKGRVVQHPQGRALLRDFIGDVLCPDCRARYAPLTKAMHKKLTKLNNGVWRELMKMGCPCCCGIEWHRAAEESLKPKGN